MEADLPARLAANLKRLSVPAAARFKPFICLDCVDSTNSYLRRLIDRNPSDGLVVMSRTQTNGRGRLGRRWASLPGNLHLSVLRRMQESLEQSTLVPLLAGLALARAVHHVGGVVPSLKWPNDLLVGDKKLAGILVESASCWQMLGIGLNISTTEFPPEVAKIATSLALETDRTCDPVLVVAQFLLEFHELEVRFHRHPELPVNEYMRYFPYCGTAVRVQSANRIFDGRIQGVSPDGALVVLTSEAGEVKVRSGEVIHVRSR